MNRAQEIAVDLLQVEMRELKAKLKSNETQEEKMIKVNKEQYYMMLNMALEFSKGHKSVSHDALRPDIEYVWIDNVKIAEIRHKGKANEEYYMVDFK